MYKKIMCFYVLCKTILGLKYLYFRPNSHILKEFKLALKYFENYILPKLYILLFISHYLMLVLRG